MSGLIDVRDLSIEFETRGMKVPALDRVSFRIDPGATVRVSLSRGPSPFGGSGEP